MFTQDGWMLVIDGSQSRVMRKAHCRGSGQVLRGATSGATESEPQLHELEK